MTPISFSLLALACSNSVPPDRQAESPQGDAHDTAEAQPSPDTPPVSEEQDEEGIEPAEVIEDGDGDGFSSDIDCEDEDPRIHPGAPEYCDGIDTDCDGVIDPYSALDAPLWFRDTDGDGFGNSDDTMHACSAPQPGWVALGGDCDDTEASTYPGAEELCDGVDADCDGAEASGIGTWYPGGGVTGEDVTAQLESGLVHRTEHGELKLCEGVFDARLQFEVEGLSASIVPEVSVKGLGEVRLSGGGTRRIIEVGEGVGTLRIENLRLTDGAASSGAALVAHELDLVLDTVGFSSNRTTGPGGAVSIEQGSIELSEVSFFNNEASGHGAHGGAVYLGEGSVGGENATFYGNVAEGMASGGAVFVGSGEVDLVEASFSVNRADYKGGAIALLDGSVTLSDSGVDRNHALAGGGIFVAGSLDLDATLIERNAATSGGGVFLDEADDDQTLACEDGGLQSNEASSQGDAVYVASPFGTAIDSDDCDWGSGGTDNGTGADIVTPMSTISAPDSATFTCLHYTCTGDASVDYH